jgi:hypothetical protein
MLNKKSESNIVIVEDVDFEIFEEVLQYIYCGNIPNLDKLGISLYRAANKVRKLSVIWIMLILFNFSV